MKRNLLLMTLMLLSSVFAANLKAQDVIIDQKFDDFTEGSEQKPATTDISGYSGKLKKTIGWNGKYVYEAGGMLKIGDGGYLRTDNLKAITSTTNIKVTFDVRCIDSYGGGVAVKLGYTPAGTTMFSDNGWHTVSLIIPNARSTSYIQFEPYLSASGLLIDNVKVEASDKFIPVPEARQPIIASKTSFKAWWKSVSGAESYLLDVYTKTTDGKDYLLKDQEVTGTSYTVDGLEAGKTYYYTVRAKKGENVSDYSNEIEVVEVVYSVDAPEALPATDVTANGFTANWNKVEGATLYDVKLTRHDTMAEDKDVDLISDDFSKVTEGTLSSVEFPASSSNLDKYTKVPGWSSYMPCLAAGHIGLAPISAGSDSYLVTPALNLSQADGRFKVTVRLAEINYGTEMKDGKAIVRLYNGDATEPAAADTITLEKGFKDYTAEFEGGTAESYVEVYYNGSYKLFVDSMAVSQSLKKGDTFSTLVETRELDDVQTTQFDVPLSADVAYSYVVVAYVRTVVDGEIGYLPSKDSNRIDVKFDGPSSVNGITSAAGAVVTATDGGVIVTLESAAQVRIYNAAGQLTASVSGQKGANRITLAPGLSIVKVGTKAVKVVVK